MLPISILIPNRWTWEAIELTVESVLERTRYDGRLQIIVCDNSHGKGDGNRIDYLKGMQELGQLRLVENPAETTDRAWKSGEKIRYGHGENIRVLLRECDTPLAVLLSSGTEIVDPQWLNILAMRLNPHNKILGVARLRHAENHFDTCLSAYRWVPNWMLLDMVLYRKFGKDEDWDLMRVPYQDYWHKEIFKNTSIPKNPDPEPLHVFLDTGWRLWERLEYENPEGYKMAEMPPKFPWRQIRFWGGLDRNSYRPEHPFVMNQRMQIRKRLELLRGG